MLRIDNKEPRANFFQYHFPYLYRYENARYISEFFERGKLKLSSFARYRTYKDNQLGDSSEGHFASYAYYNVKGQPYTAITKGVLAVNSYSFCTSLRCSEDLMGIFSRDSVFRIRDVPQFINEIVISMDRYLEPLGNKVTGVDFGNCSYVSRKLTRADVPPFLREDLLYNSDPNVIDADKLRDALRPFMNPINAFLKPREYEQQQEYRILFQTQYSVDDSIVIDCPQAARHCQLLKDFQDELKS